jgi:hypothetical protein
LLTGLVGLCLFGLSACAKGNGTVEGLIFEAQREIAIEGVVVSIRSLEGSGEEQFTLNDINGLYHFDGVPEGLNRVTVVKEGYDSPSSSLTTKFADVVEDETLTLDFVLLLVPRSITQDLLVRVRDDRGPLAGATVDHYRGPCIGRSGVLACSSDTIARACIREMPAPQDADYCLEESLITNANGEVRVRIASVQELIEYMVQFRITAPEHQNRVFDLLLNLENLPAVVEYSLPRQ